MSDPSSAQSVNYGVSMTDREVLHSSASEDWFTPAEIIERVRNCLGRIDLDPASCEEANRIVKANYFHDKESDGIRRNYWHGTVFLNPPGGQLIHKASATISAEDRAKDLELSRKYKTRSRSVAWWRKLLDEYRTGRVTGAVFLGFRLDILQGAQGNAHWPGPMHYAICVPKERIKFSGSKAPSHANFLCGVGVDPERFKECFKTLGDIKICNGYHSLSVWV